MLYISFGGSVASNTPVFGSALGCKTPSTVNVLGTNVSPLGNASVNTILVASVLPTLVIEVV
ncbi:Uncharacterised protein [Streptococcus pneumoniae]|nr:Uncharacterised protein [Streptococcus pneumoniae]